MFAGAQRWRVWISGVTSDSTGRYRQLPVFLPQLEKYPRDDATKMMQQPELKTTGVDWIVDTQESKALGNIFKKKKKKKFGHPQKDLATGNATTLPGIVGFLCNAIRLQSEIARQVSCMG